MPTKALAEVTCEGKILDIVKWSDSEDLSIKLENTGRWVKFQDTTSISMALTAFAAQKTVSLYMNSTNITQCNEGWPHYTVHAGYFLVKN